MTEDKEQPAPPAEAPAPETTDAEPAPEAPPAEDTSPARAEPVPAAAPPRRRGGALAVLALLLALAAAGGTGYLWWLDRQREPVVLPDVPDVAAAVEQRTAPLRAALEEARRELEQSLAGLRDEVERGLDASRRENERLAAGRDGVDRALARVEDETRRGFSGLERRLTNLETALATLADRRANTTEELALTETEFLLRAGTERLQLFNDPRGAITALTLAQSRLEAVDDPLYATVRQTLAGHLEDLRQVELPDRVALSGRLLGLARNSVEWPLDARRSLKVTGANLLTPNEQDTGWWPRLKEVLSNVVVVHREKEAEAVLLTLEEERLLRENVRLQLQVAQLAAVRGEQPLYEAAIEAVSDWLGRYYDAASSQVTAAIEQLTELRGIDLNPPLPDVGAALRQLRNVRAADALAADADAADAP